MLDSSKWFLSLITLVAFWGVHGRAGPAPRTPGGTYRPSTVVSQSYNASQLGSVAGTAPTGLYSQSNTTLGTSSPTSQDPVESAQMHAKTCLVGACSGVTAATKTVDEDIAGLGGPLTMLPDSELQSACVLWNASCSGDKTAARNYFFATLKQDLDANACFTKPKADCTKIESPARMSEFQAIQDWMRSPQCFSGKAGYNSMVGMSPPIQDTENCCGTCGLTAGIVDVYYWPVANASTSCLDIIGTKVNPLTYGATIGLVSDGYNYWSDKNGVLTSSVPTYWGCTTETSGQLSFMSTALVTQIDSITFKQYLVNPWSAPSCVGSSPPSPRSSGALAPRASIHARAHAINIQNTTSQVGDSPASTAVVSGFTFTSPSIYANFQSISGSDECGSQTISSTMLSFAPGRLSTIEGGLNCPTCLSQSTKPFDFRDLPCPPQRVMEANWYKPEPGEPYRPLIAMPEQIQKVNPFFGRCSDAFFTGFDPPKTLLPATAMVPTTTAADPNAATSTAPMPSATQDPGAKKTTSDEGMKPVAGPTLAAQVPKETANSVPDPKQTAPALVSKSEDPKASEGSPALPGSIPHGAASESNKASGAVGDPGQATRPTTPSGNPKQESGSHGDPGQVSDPKATGGNNGGSDRHNDPKKASNAPQISDPSNVSPYQMSQINNALAPSPQGSQAAPISVQGNYPGSNQQGSPSRAVPISPGSPQAGNTQALPNNESPQPNTALPSIGDSNPIPKPPATTMSVSNHVIAVYASGIHFDGSPVASDQAHVVVSSVMAMNPSAGIVLSNYVVNMPSPTQPPNADIQPFPKYGPTVIVGESAQRVSNGISIAGITVTPGAAPITISGTAIAVGSSGIIIGASSVPIATVFPEQVAPANAAKYQPTTILGQIAQPVSNGIFIAGATLTPGASPITVSGTAIAVGSSGLIIGSSTIPLPTIFPQQAVPANTPSYEPTTIIGQVAQSVSSGISIAGATLAPGAPPITISGTPVFVGSSGLVIGSSTVPLAAVFPPITPNAPQYQPTTINGEKAQLLPNGGISIAGTTLTAGASAITVSGTPISVGSSNLIIGSSTIPLAAAFTPQIAPNTAGYQPTTINDQKAQLLPNGVSIAGSTLTSGAPAITISGTPISIGSSGLVIGTRAPIPLTNAFPSQIITTLANQAITILPTAVEIAGATLTPGAPPLTISGIPISINPSALIIGTATIALPSAPQQTTINGQLITTLANQALTAAPTAVEIAGTTLTPGASGITLSGTLVSLNTAGGLILGSQTIALQSESGGLGGLIMAPFATSASSTPTSTPTGTGNSTSNGSGGKPVAGAANDLQLPTLLKGLSTLLVIVFILKLI